MFISGGRVQVSKHDVFEPIAASRNADLTKSFPLKWKMKLDVKHLVDHWV